ncbi:MAG TPA: SDR family oxidoreductase [Geminicoccaceae bacterium]|nr:SDR family oxidoreductase [Geminicoccaceae bacterium]
MTPRLKNLGDQTIVITGASSGIGLATARLAAARGARVVLAARGADGLRTAADRIRNGGEVATVVADVAGDHDVRRVAEIAQHRFGGFDTWINNAAVSVYGPLERVPLEDQRRVFETNYWGVVHGSLVALEHLKHRGGAIINVGSVLSERAFPLQAAYSASKHAIKGFTDALRMEVMHERLPVSVTLIKPAGIDTPYEEHAANYLPMRPRNPPPLYAPEVVARAILHSAEHPVRELTVGGAGRLLETVDRWLPGLTDAVMARVLPRSQQSREPASERGPDGLHAAAGDGRERSGKDYPVFERSAYTWAAMNPSLAMGLAVLVGIALGRSGRRGRRS